MHCPYCGVPLASDSRYCGACGRSNQLASSAAGEVGAGALATDDTVLDAPAMPRIMVTPPPDPYIGETLGNRFKVDSKLGEGGFGAVYVGTQKGTGRKVALKLLHPDLTQDDNLVKRFQREGVILCGLRDAHTVTTYDFDQTEDGTLFIAMELLQGRSLHQVFNEEAPLAWDRAFRILRQMCSSLAEAHEQGIVHRDLKPENIYLETRPGNPEFVKILDFGIAKVVQGDGAQAGTQLTATGQTLGTLEYMSPEQLMGKDLDGRSDVYAIGVVCYELITKRLPFPDFKGPAGLITAQLRQIPDPPSVAYPPGNIPPEVDQAILRMLEKDKASRFQDMNELRARCDELLANAPGRGALGPDPGYPSTASTQPPRDEPATIPRYPGALPGPQHGSQPPSSPGHSASALPLPAPQHDSVHPHSQPPVRVPTPAPGQVQMPVAHVGPDPGMSYPQAGQAYAQARATSNRMWLWIALAVIAVGGAIGLVLAQTI